MAAIRPFSGLRYNSRLVPDLAAVIAPPYDVINERDVEELQTLNPYNITHLTRPAGTEPYAHAAQIYHDWREQNVLSLDGDPSLYLYAQQFADPDTGHALPERLGLVCLLDLEDYSSGMVLPHENTLTAARTDRLNLLRATEANFESIYGLFSDPEDALTTYLREQSDLAPIVSEVNSAIGSSHRLQRIKDQDVIGAIVSALKDKPVFIADGHHRYETSLAYQKERPDLPGAKSILITLTALQDPGLLVLPTHRLLRGFAPNLIADLPRLLVSAGFDVTEASAEAPPLLLLSRQFMLVTPGHAYRMTVPQGMNATETVAGSQSDAWKSLDVTLLHTLIIDKILGVPLTDLATTSNIKYTRDANEARAKVADGTYQAAFLMARPSVAEMQAVSEAGDKMPQKSTFFYPKLLSGLVLRDLRDG